MRATACFAFAVVLALPAAVAAQEEIAQPAEEVAGEGRAEPQGGEAQDERTGRVPSYEAEAVVPPPPGTLREGERIGDYGQPRWSAHRRFPTTRVYVRPAGQMEFEWWLTPGFNLEDFDDTGYESQFEFEFGLGHRLQLDIYLVTAQEGHQGPLQITEEKVELRYALADWGVIPLNPTLYGEFIRKHEGAPVVEFKVLLGDQIADRLYFGTNLVFEHALAGERENEYKLTSGVAYTLIDMVLSVGAEVELETADVKNDRFGFDKYELLAGPSVRWQPTPPMHLLLVGLFGFEKEGDETTPLAQPTLVAGWEL